jgi:hypothetical protein
VVGQLTAQIIASFLYDFPQFTCVFFIHINLFFVLSLLLQVFYKLSYKIL